MRIHPVRKTVITTRIRGTLIHQTSMRFRGAAFIGAVVTATAVAAADAPSALGVTLGMTPSQAEGRLVTAAKLVDSRQGGVAYGRPGQQVELPNSGYLVTQQFAVSTASVGASQVQDVLKLFYSPVNHGERVVNITREQHFHTGFRPQAAVRMQDYIDKFGKPTWTGTPTVGTEQHMLWLYEEDGSQRSTASPDAMRWCETSFGSGSVLDLTTVTVSNRVPRMSLCGAVTMYVRFQADNTGAINHLLFGAVDNKSALDALAVVASSIRKHSDERQQAEKDRTRANKPAL